MTDKGFRRDQINQFSTLTRIVDFCFIPLALFIILNATQHNLTQVYIILSLIYTSSFLLFAETIQLYRSWSKNKVIVQLIYTVISTLIAIACVTTFLFFSKNGQEVSRVVIGLWFVITLLGVTTWRIILKIIVSYFRTSVLHTKKIAIIGFTTSGVELATELHNNPNEGYELSAIFDDRTAERLPDKFTDKFFGSVNEGVECAKVGQFDVVYIALPSIAQQRIGDILKKLGNTTVDIRILPSYLSYSLLDAQISSIGNVETLSVNESPHQGGSLIAKRLLDIVLSISILTLIAIPMLVIACLIKFDSKGDIIFKQSRYGLSGQRISVWKFRSMTVQENGDAVKQVTKNDMRITNLGRLLRKTSLDELPQFLNVLRGDMSIVGPRPHAVAHNEQYREDIDFYMMRHKVKPGITGWAQINGWRGETDSLFKMQKRVEYDLDYIKNWNLVFDMKIVLLTITRGFTDKNAF